MENNKTPYDVKIQLYLREYFDSEIFKELMSPFCPVISEKLIIKSIDLETKYSPIKYNILMQLKK